MRTISLIAVMLILSGCGATPYQRIGAGGYLGASGGYSSTQLDANVFEVMFKGNSDTSRNRANNFVLLRSAELAIENGYEYFVIIDTQQYSKNSIFTTPTTSTTKITPNIDGTATAKTIMDGGKTHLVSEPRSSKTIVCFNEKPEGFSYNARFIEKSLKKKYQLNKPN